MTFTAKTVYLRLESYACQVRGQKGTGSHHLGSDVDKEDQAEVYHIQNSKNNLARNKGL